MTVEHAVLHEAIWLVTLLLATRYTEPCEHNRKCHATMQRTYRSAALTQRGDKMVSIPKGR